jgi:hypothetical protein
LYYIDADGKEHRAITNESLISLGEKQIVLEKNLINLLRQQKKLSSTEFKFLMDKYSDTLRYYAQFTSWMQETLDDQKTDLPPYTSMYFEAQKIAFQNHQKEIVKYFPSKVITIPKTLDWSSYYESDLPPIKQLSNIAIIEKQVVKKKKPILITDEEAQRYLLETVFKVKVD